MAINFNTGPYYDDFDPANNFYKILFKPGYAVQARELNQLQSILQHQISSASNHIFKKNTVVIPGGIALNTVADILAISGIEDPAALVGQTITNASNFDYTDDSTLDGYITAIVLGYRPSTDTYPTALYIKYIKSATTEEGTTTSKFALNESLYTVGPTLYEFNVDGTYGSTVGKVATLAKGTFYTKELFVDAATQSVIVETNTNTQTNCIIGLNVVESIVTSDEDESLLDNSNGTPNQYAPGADRYKVDLVLTRIDLNAAFDEDKFIKMMVVEDNVVTYINNNTQYAELMKTLARRTYDANGNFIVRGLDSSVVESPDDDYMWMNVGAGKCYLGGYEYNQLTDHSMAVANPRSDAYQVEMKPISTYSSGLTYMYVAGTYADSALPQANTLIHLLNAAPGTVGVQVIGYAVSKYVQYINGTVGVDDYYKMFFDYIALEKGYNISDIGGVSVIGGVADPSAGKGLPVLHEMRLTNVLGTFTLGGTIVPGTTSSTETAQIYATANNRLYAIKNTTYAVPATETVALSAGGATAVRNSTFVSNFSTNFVPMIQVDSDIIKTLYQDGSPTLSYSVVRIDEYNSVAAGNLEPSTLLGANEYYEDVSPTNFYAYNVTAQQFIDDFHLLVTISSDRYSVEIAADSPLIGDDIRVFSTYVRESVTESLKSAVTLATPFEIPNPSKSWMALGHQDVVELVSVVDGDLAVVFNASKAGDWSLDKTLIFTTNDPHGLQVGDVIVVKGVLSTGNTLGSYNLGFNGQFTVSAVDDTETFRVVASDLRADPGIDAQQGLIALPPKPGTGVDITSRFILDTGNTLYGRGTAMIKLKKKATAPVGQLAVRYKYYSTGAGNYVSVDSYVTGEPGDLSYIADIPDVMLPDGTKFTTRNQIDFRSTTSKYFFKNIGTIATGTNKLVLKDLNLSGLADLLVNTTVGQERYVVGPSHNHEAVKINAVTYNALTGDTELTLDSNAAATFTGTYYIGLYSPTLSLTDTTALTGGATVFSFPKDATRISYQYTKFTPKRVIAYVKRDGDQLTVDVMEVSSVSEVLSLRRNEFKLPLAYMYMKPYCLGLNDISLVKFENPVYQMLDIHNLKQRIDRTEYYASLALENDLNQTIIDAMNENLDQSGRGFWNEDFMNMGSQDIQSDDFACTIYDKSYVSPGTDITTINLVFDQTANATTWRRTGSNITLPYTEVKLLGNTAASKFNNLNPFNVINWPGKIQLNPSVDNWVDTALAPIQTTKTTTVIPSPTPAPAPAPTPAPASPPPILPPPPLPVVEVVTEINNVRTKWGPDSRGGYHAITFDWKTNLGKTGRVNTDYHLASVLSKYSGGIDGTYARSLINKPYNDSGVKDYLNAGVHFDQKPPRDW
jgi:hypothetical protein